MKNFPNVTVGGKDSLEIAKKPDVNFIASNLTKCNSLSFLSFHFILAVSPGDSSSECKYSLTPENMQRWRKKGLAF